jgi:hypothetical protein
MPYRFNPFTNRPDYYEAGVGTVTSVSGTANRITVTNPTTTPVIDIAATYVGQTSITTLGTIATGTWNGTAIGPTFGGTGQTTYTTGDILYASAANTLSKLPIGSAGEVLTVAGGIPDWLPASGGSSVYFQAYLTSITAYPTNNTSNVVVFDTAISNVGSGYNTATGVFTAPSTGFYSFSATLFFQAAAGTTQFLIAYKGSVQSLRLSQIEVLSAISSVAWAMPMTAGDTVYVVPYADGAGTFNLVGAALSSSAFNTASIFSGFKVA